MIYSSLHWKKLLEKWQKFSRSRFLTSFAYQGLSKDIGNSFASCSEVVSFQPEAKKIAYISMGTQLGMFTGEVKNKKR